MEKFNFPGGKNVVKSICWILSYFSWLLAAATNLAALKWMYDPQKSNPICFIWNIVIIPNYINNSGNYEDGSRRRLNSPAKRNIRKLANGLDLYYPLQMSELMIYIVLNFAFAMIFAGCVVYIVKTFIKRDIQAIDGLFGKFSQFHFFPFLCNFVMSLLGILSGDDMEKWDDFAK